MSQGVLLDLDLVRRRLRTSWVGRDLGWSAVLDSTNEQLLRQAEQGAQLGTVRGAETQTAGRGRRGRTWRDRAGRDLLFSVLLSPVPVPTGLLSLVPAAFLAEALEDYAGAPVRVRWPNDLMCGEAKLGGLLLEMRGGRLVLGLGLNVLGAGDALTAVLGRDATTLQAEASCPVEREAVLAACLEAVEGAWDALCAGVTVQLQARLAARDCLRGRNVVVSAAGDTWRGVAAGLAPDGGLLLRTPSGEKRFTVAEVVRVEHHAEA